MEPSSEKNEEKDEYYDDIKLPVILLSDPREVSYNGWFHPSTSRGDESKSLCCESCGGKEVHSEDDVPTKKFYECPHCGLRFLLSIALKYHIKGSHGSEPFYQCSYCTFTSHLLPQVKRHVREAHTSEKRHYCPHCKYKAKRSTHLRRHIEARHNINHPPKRRYTIKAEHDTDTEITSVAVAPNRNVDEDEKPLLCSECGYTTFIERSLKRHIKKIHAGKGSIHKCTLCEFACAQLRELRHHVKVEHEKAKCFECPCCPYRTVHLGSLKNHVMAKHTDEKTYKCMYCTYTAVQSGNLKRHVRMKHPNKRGRPRTKTSKAKAKAK